MLASSHVGSLAALLPDGSDPDSLLKAFTTWTQEQRITLYEAQQEALIAAFLGSHVIVNTPTGSGKSMIALGTHFAALAQGIRSAYVAPLKALVSEKFFDLARAFGSANVGMITGDSSVNPQAPIICCTAEILANMALRDGEDADIGHVVMDEFHFYADPQRGWAWQIPLLEMTNTQFILMSATLGDVSFFEKDLLRRTGREVVTVTSAHRPVPLQFSYSLQPLPELIEELIYTQRVPAYIVHFTQAAAVERAQALLSRSIASRQEKDTIAREIGDFRFGPGFGKTLSKLVRNGIGIHHAGMLPKYRRLVERLTQAGLLKVVCGTDTLGVGINVPIKTVVFTSLVKFDGERMRHLTAREFHQIAGRAGRAGFDTLGDVIVQAPEHVIENAKALAKAGDDERKRRKIVRKKAPVGAVNWTDKTFERLRDAAPEPLTSQFSVSHSMVLHVLARPGDPVAAMSSLLYDNHDAHNEWNPYVRRAVNIYRSLRAGGVIERLTEPDEDARTVRLTVDLPDNFALNQPLSPFALAAMELLDGDDPEYALNVISIVEATLDDPRQVLYAQESAAKRTMVAELKAEGYDYNDRVAMIDEVSHPQPLADTLNGALEVYRQQHPWVTDYELSPKSVLRDMVEHVMTFPEFISHYQLARSEGVVLRYLMDAYRTLRQTVPADQRTAELEEIIEWLGETIRSVDSSLLEEWENLQNPQVELEGVPASPSLGEKTITTNRLAFRRMVRNEMFKRVELAARDDVEALGKLDEASGWSADRWDSALGDYYDAHADIGIGPEARGAAFIMITEEGSTWQVRQIIDDPAGDRDWVITAEVDLNESDRDDKVALTVLDFCVV